MQTISSGVPATACARPSLPLQQVVTRNGADALVDSDRFRAGMSNVGGACAIITTCNGNKWAGMTATAMCSVSASPPRLLVCVNRNTYAYGLIHEGRRVGVNMLAAEHEELAKRFAGMLPEIKGEDRFQAGKWNLGEYGSPVLEDAIVSFQCSVFQEIPSGTHSIIVCDIHAIETNSESVSALMYFNRSFAPVPGQPYL